MKQIPKNEWENCPMCNNEGGYLEGGGVSYVTRDMASDACDLTMEGMAIHHAPDHVQCEFCWTNPKSVYYQENKLWESQNAGTN